MKGNFVSANKQPKNKELKFLTALVNGRASGRTISRRQAKQLYRLNNPSSAVLRFEQSGWPVVRSYTTKRVKRSDGGYNYITTVNYQLGK